ncbi:unnamed protein product [Spirodela intermedia]|uniref:Uncharacterized protein n=1 Tax=Spirodela intermedia TaxID=51605 RepID=A0A7I8LDA3_SPIIN|nr:unnamed protein product [Spirodela intermedia]
MGPREGQRLVEGNKKKIKAWLMSFSCLRSSWRRDYLEHIKIITDQASLGLGLTHNEICFNKNEKLKIIYKILV